MSASLFHWEWYSDPPWDRVSLWWLVNYVKNVRSKPRAKETMLANRAEFEAVPVPVSVLRHLATADVDPGTLPQQPPVDRTPLVDLLNRFSRALEAQDVETAMSTVSRSYFDVLGRNRSQLQKDLQQLVGDLPGLRVRLGTEELDAVGNQLVAVLDVEWKSDAVAPAGVRGGRNSTRIELFLGRTPRDAWQIESIRTI
jgi:hypothetical protein